MTLVLSKKLIDNGMKINVQDFDVTLEKLSNIRPQFLVYWLKLHTTKTYPNFVRFDQFLLDLQQIFRPTDRHFKFSHGKEINNGV